MKIQNKRGQISEGITWVVATIAIFVMLLFSLFLTSFTLKNKTIEKDFFSDTINSKSFLSYLLTKQTSGENVYFKIKQDGNLSSENGMLAQKIFNGLYKEKYSEIWIGVSEFRKGVGDTTISGIKNDFFGNKPSSVAHGYYGSVILKEYYASILLLNKENDKQIFTEAIFMKKAGD